MPPDPDSPAFAGSANQTRVSSGMVQVKAKGHPGDEVLRKHDGLQNRELGFDSPRPCSVRHWRTTRTLTTQVANQQPEAVRRGLRLPSRATE